ncbi:MAG: translation initiation factor [Bacteroidota bacterium]|jgi:translation initiation factor IF-2
MTEEKTIRLSKAIKEFNLSMDHIVEFLSKKGISVESNPNTKLPGEAYALLQKEFQGDKILKEEAQQLTQTKLKRETQVVLDASTTKKPSSKKDEESSEILIKNVTVADFLGTEKKKKTETAEVTEEKKAKTTKTKSDDVIKAKAEKVDGPKVLGKIEIEGDEPKTEKKKTTKKKKSEEAEVEPTAATTTTAPEVIVSGTEAVSTPIAETTEEKVTGDETKEDAEDKFHRVQIDKLTGPTVLGKIELPQERKKPVASSTTGVDKGEKKKRKRTERKGGGQPIPQDKRGTAAPGARGGRKEVASTDQRAELSDKEIQEKIKATLARLSGAGKSKSSKMRKQRREERAEEREQQAAEESGKKVIKVTEFVTANELAKLMDVPVTNIISTCMSLGMFVSINQRLDAETLSVVAEEFGYTVEFVSAEVQDTILQEEDREEDMISRFPIVTVMGHVDHGKTSLLDYIRKANVIAGEAGGITQHIGAYNVELENGKHITFLDTPGHEAFTAMRARGAKVTDVAIIVIAADDSVMPQTVEAINHAQAAGVPMVFAINKVDKPEAQPERIKEQLAKMNILVEDWGGKYQCQEISAKKGMNVEQLLEKVLLEAEMLDLKANPKRRANGTVIESSLDKGRGYIMTVLVQGGTLRVGDVLISGCYSGRVKALFNERGFRIKEAGPAMPAQVLGMTGASQAGDLFNVMEDEREARDIANKRLQLQREQGIRTRKHITLDEIGRRLAIGNFKELNVIVKGDVDGSIEALADSLLKLSTGEVQVNIIHKSVGQITESDVLLASASNAIIIGFQVRPSVNARKLAETEEIEIRLYSIIYKAIEELKQAMEGMLAPEFQEKITGNIEIRETFKIPKVGTIAGCMVLDGKFNRNTKVRVVRDGIVVFSGELGSLKRFKDDVKEVATGYECGLSIHNFNDIRTGDIIEGYEQVAVKRTLA